MNNPYSNSPCHDCFQNNSCLSVKKYLAKWLIDNPPTTAYPNIIEVKFKNRRCDFYRNSSDLKLKIGDVVVVESTPGYDVGTVNMLDDIFFNPTIKKNLPANLSSLKKIYSLAKDHHMRSCEEAKSLESTTLIKARKIVKDLQLDMKLSDVEYQADKQKAYFYYIADGRIDYRKLIRVLAEEFHIQVVMKQIGSRQESTYVGGIGVCGLRLCCSAWINHLESISTSNARVQDIAFNPQKHTGQCGKLKCCLAFEVKTYIEAQKNLPPAKKPIVTEQGKALHQKSDVLEGIMWYAYENAPLKQFPLKAKQVKEMLKLNKLGRIVKSLPLEEKKQDIVTEF